MRAWRPAPRPDRASYVLRAARACGASNALPGYLGFIPVPGFGIAVDAFNYFRHGKNIVVPKGTLFEIFPSDDPKTAKCQKEDG